ncbi:hypothetical protein EII34_15150 [Arachnia propionica]|uniref:Uncharacterized protein n=1 Tax=Arachnia propionica TaxID=1750 RepID=A0A3P1T1G2_9ACTN|nr:hypothetical protein [Arachnia propionica]RRD03240.1 hypothetical protein EII34_15150 [Arachnia propionica]
MPDLPSLDGLTSTQLIELLEDAQRAYMAAVEREKAEAASAQQQLITLAEQLGQQIAALTAIVEAPAESLDPVQAVRTIAGALGQVTELARQSVLVGAQAAEMHH